MKKPSTPLRILRTAAVAYALFWAVSLAVGRASKVQI